jgi:NADH-quinone oxidoreductase subunit A
VPVGFSVILVFSVVGVAFVVICLALSWLLRPHRPNPEKLAPYECGVAPTGQGWYQANIRYYLFAIVFVLFDIETAYLYPWAIQFRAEGGVLRLLQRGGFLVGEMLIFLGILMFGLIYAWRKGALEWE